MISLSKKLITIPDKKRHNIPNGSANLGKNLDYPLSLVELRTLVLMLRFWRKSLLRLMISLLKLMFTRPFKRFMLLEENLLNKLNLRLITLVLKLLLSVLSSMKDMVLELVVRMSKEVLSLTDTLRLMTRALTEKNTALFLNYYHLKILPREDSLLLTLTFPNSVFSVSNMVTVLPIPTTWSFGKLNLVISLMVLKLWLITSSFLVKVSGNNKLVWYWTYLMVWMVKVLNILLPDLNVSFNCLMMIPRFMNSTSQTVSNCNPLKLTSKFA